MAVEMGKKFLFLVAFLVSLSVPAFAQSSIDAPAIDPSSRIAPILTFFEFQLPIFVDQLTNNQDRLADDQTSFLVERELEHSQLIDEFQGGQIDIGQFAVMNDALTESEVKLASDISQTDSASPDSVDDGTMAEVADSVRTVVNSEQDSGIAVVEQSQTTDSSGNQVSVETPVSGEQMSSEATAESVTSSESSNGGDGGG